MCSEIVVPPISTFSLQTSKDHGHFFRSVKVSALRVLFQSSVWRECQSKIGDPRGNHPVQNSLHHCITTQEFGISAVHHYVTSCSVSQRTDLARFFYSFPKPIIIIIIVVLTPSSFQLIEGVFQSDHQKTDITLHLIEFHHPSNHDVPNSCYRNNACARQWSLCFHTTRKGKPSRHFLFDNPRRRFFFSPKIFPNFSVHVHPYWPRLLQNFGGFSEC